MTREKENESEWVNDGEREAAGADSAGCWFSGVLDTGSHRDWQRWARDKRDRRLGGGGDGGDGDCIVSTWNEFATCFSGEIIIFACLFNCVFLPLSTLLNEHWHFYKLCFLCTNCVHIVQFCLCYFGFKIFIFVIFSKTQLSPSFGLHLYIYNKILIYWTSIFNIKENFEFTQII